LTVDEAVAIAIQVGDALARAHRVGIVHRDLKPGNVMLVRRAGPAGPPDVKLLDFGLAARAAVARPTALDGSLAATAGPSLVATRPPTAHVAGFSGTLQYMAPEQLDGDPGDHRADIFALGCVFYEMLAGRKAFEGGTAVTVIAAIMTTEPPPVAALQSANPLLDHVLKRCLEKDRERRWQSIDDVTGELRWIADHPLQAPAAAAVSAWPSRVGRIAMAAALVLATAGLAAMGFALRSRGVAPAAPSVRFEVSTAPTDDPSLAVSPDGTLLAFVANQDRVPVLWVRSLEGLENRALPGTERASLPFWSPDSRAIGFFADNKLKRIDVAGGTPIVLADAPSARGGAWNADGVMLIASGIGAPIKSVRARGGPVENVTVVSAATGPDHRFPQFLPDGRRFLYSSSLGTAETNGVYLGSLDNTAAVRVVSSDGAGRYAPPDRLLTIERGALQAYSFDAASGAVRGEPVVLAQGFAGAAGSGAFSASASGVVAYRAGTVQRRQLVWVSRQGVVLRPIGEPQSDFISSPELSADERSVLVFQQRTGDNDIWLIELERNLARRITDGPPADAQPLWDPDGGHVVFFSRRFGGGGPARQPLTGGSAAPLFARGEPGAVASWTRDREYVLVRRVNAQTGSDVVAIATLGEPREIVVAQSRAEEMEGQFSPDGKWVAFVSTESGSPEVFVQSFPEGQRRTQVSTAGGTQVRWSRDGKEIFYLAPDERMMAVSIVTGGAALDVKLPVPLFQTRLASGTNVLGTKPQYDVARDGRFLLNTAVESASAPIVVWVNWMKKLPPQAR
jgi:Tol biopolymer transport system component